MHSANKDWERLLLRVQKPSRYLGGEVNSIKKDWKSARVRMVFAFPDTYEVGMSHFGMSLLYHHVNTREEFLADRVFAPWLDMEKELRATGLTLLSLDHKKPLKEFDLIGFSLQYELSFTNILTILDLAGIPLLASDRNEGDWPFIVGGGPCVFNPEPVAAFFDFFVLGEGEEVLGEILEKLCLKKEDRADRKEFLEEIRHIPGIYIPEFFKPTYSTNGLFAGVKPAFEDYELVQKAVVSDLDSGSPLPEKPLVPFMKIVHDRLNVEIARGCTRGCRFCQAGMIYRPVRERAPGEILEIAEKALRATGFEELSLLSLSSGDYSSIEFLLTALMARYKKERVSVALPSLRIGTLSSRLISEIKKVRKTGFTLAPEAGSERLRRVINKDISTDELLEVASYIYRNGWQLIKLYFMTGLPTETRDDLEALVDLCYRVWSVAGKAKPKGRVNISISTFVPKPHTPFQWSAQIPLEKIHGNLDFFKSRLNRRGMKLKWHNPLQSFMEAVLSRGDRRLSEVILRAWMEGARFDGWTEQFRFELWEKAFKSSQLPENSWIPSKKDPDDPLPWDHLHSKVEKKFLVEEYGKALSGEYTYDCRQKKCLKCGVCDFKEIQPLLKKLEKAEEELLKGNRDSGDERSESGFHYYRIRFKKTGTLKLLSHLELVELFSRAIRRAELPVAFSRGYNPHMKVSFWHALPVGFESMCEYLNITLVEKLGCDDIRRNLNNELPCGIEILQVENTENLTKWPGEYLVVYRVNLFDKTWPQHSWHEFVESPRQIEKITKKGRKRSYDLAKYIKSLVFKDEKTIELSLKQSMSGCPTLLEAMAGIFGQNYAMPSEIAVTKLDVLPVTGDSLWQQN